MKEITPVRHPGQKGWPGRDGRSLFHSLKAYGRTAAAAELCLYLFPFMCGGRVLALRAVQAVMALVWGRFFLFLMYAPDWAMSRPYTLSLWVGSAEDFVSQSEKVVGRERPGRKANSPKSTDRRLQRSSVDLQTCGLLDQ